MSTITQCRHSSPSSSVVRGASPSGTFPPLRFSDGRSVIPTRGLADSLGLPKSSRVRIDGGEGEIRHATGAYTTRGLWRRSPARGGSEDEERYPGASPFGTGRDL